MKRLIIAFIMLLLTPVLLLASVFDSVDGLPLEAIYYWVSIPALVAAILPATSIVNLIFKLEDKPKKYLSWGVGIILSLVGWYFNLGIFADIKWFIAATYGFICALSANGAFGEEFIKKILEYLKLEPKTN